MKFGKKACLAAAAVYSAMTLCVPQSFAHGALPASFKFVRLKPTFSSTFTAKQLSLLLNKGNKNYLASNLTGTSFNSVGSSSFRALLSQYKSIVSAGVSNGVLAQPQQ
jgi:hypothetical protein